MRDRSCKNRQRGEAQTKKNCGGRSILIFFSKISTKAQTNYKKYILLDDCEKSLCKRADYLQLSPLFSALVRFFLLLASFANSMISSDSLGQVIAAVSFVSRPPHLVCTSTCLIGFKGTGFRVFNSCSTLAILTWISSRDRKVDFLLLLAVSNLSNPIGASSWSFFHSMAEVGPFLSLKSVKA